MTAATLVPEQWALDPLEPAGAAELYQRVERAAPRRVRRAELEGHVGLTDRELYELGCTLAPLDIGSAGAIIGWRLVVTAGAVLCAFGLAAGVASGVMPLLGGLGDPDPLAVEPGLGVAVMFLAVAAGGRWLLTRGVEGLRRLAARRRRSAPRTAERAEVDPHARATVATMPGSGVLRVQLLWLRGDPEDAAYAELRVLGELRVDEDDAGRAEDAVATLSEVALRADRAHDLRMHHGVTPPRRQKPPAIRATSDTAPARVRREVDHAWAPDPLTDDGAAEIARRLGRARRERWTAVALAPLVVDRPVPVPDHPPSWPPDRRRRRPGPDLRRALRWPLWGGLATFVVAMFWNHGEPTTGAVVIGCAGLTVAGAALLTPRVLARRDPARRLARAARTAAANPPRALEQSLPGAAGLFEVACARERIALLHVRAAPDDGRPGELEVRTLAWRAVDTVDADALAQFWTVAEGARARSESVGRSVANLRALLGRLGRVPARTGERSLLREPVAWLGALALALLVAASIKHTVAGTWVEDGAGNRVASYAWPLFAGFLAIQAARRIRDPYAD
jgi:hypothetical protein